MMNWKAYGRRHLLSVNREEESFVVLISKRKWLLPEGPLLLNEIPRA
jgi:hypothetical protein